ncbi:MAG TPA: PilN domain-containing protein [Vicinamibacteria bacterium]
MIRINVLAADRPTKKTKKAAASSSTPSAPGAIQGYLFLGLFTVGALGLCAAAYLYQSRKLKRLDADIASAQQRQRELQAIKAQVDALERKRASYQRQVDLIERLKAEQSGPVHMLDEISKALPDFVWLTELDQTGAGVKFTGQSNGMTPVADFISALQRTGWFPAVDLLTTQEQNSVYTFSLQGAFKNPEVAAKEAAAAAAAAARGPSPAPAAASPRPAAR